MKPSHLISLFVVFGWLASPSALKAQLVSSSNQWWLNAGAGFSSGLKDGSGFPGLGLSFSSRSKIGMLSFRTVYFEEFNLCFFSPCGPALNNWDAAGLYGIIRKGKMAFASASAGLAVTGGRREVKGNFTTVGLPLETQLFLTPFQRIGVGLGIYGLANLNTEKSFWGALVCLQFGRLR